MLLVDTLAVQSVVIMHISVNQLLHYFIMTFECPLLDLGKGGRSHRGASWDGLVRPLVIEFSCELILPPEIPSIISSL